VTDSDRPGFGQLLKETSSGYKESTNPIYRRHLPPRVVFDWLSAGWRDLVTQPGLSFLYGVGIFVVCVVGLWLLFAFGWDYVLLPALAGLVILGPVLAVGLYEKSRALGAGERASIRKSVLVRPLAGAQIFFIGVLLLLVALIWMRAAVLIYALFFGYRPFPGMEHMLPVLLNSPLGWEMIITGTLVGGLFAAFAFAISVFSVPMMLDQRTDAVTAMGLSMTIAWNNIPVMIAWGAAVLVLLVVCAVTALTGLIIIFPLLGHATWHAYRAIGGPEAAVAAMARR
jgi:uncharacterized membrane protein